MAVRPNSGIVTSSGLEVLTVRISREPGLAQTEALFRESDTVTVALIVSEAWSPEAPLLPPAGPLLPVVPPLWPVVPVDPSSSVCSVVALPVAPDSAARSAGSGGKDRNRRGDSQQNEHYDYQSAGCHQLFTRTASVMGQPIP